MFVPEKDNYAKIFGTLDSIAIDAASCIGQCTGCKCNCQCSCRKTDFNLDW